MAALAAVLGGIGVALGAPAGTGAVILGGVASAATLASTGLGIAQAAGAFAPKVPKPPGFSSASSGAAVLAARKRSAAAQQRNQDVLGGRPLGPGPETRGTALFGPGGVQ